MKYVQPYGVTDPNASYVNGDPSIGRQGSIPPAAAFEQPMRELVALIEAAAIDPSATDLAQLLEAVRSQRINFAVALGGGSGDENHLVVEYDPPIAVFTPGMPLRIKTARTNTGPCTLSVDGQVAPLIRANGADLADNDLPAGMVVDVVWDGTNWQVANFVGITSGTTNTNNYLTEIPYIADSGGSANSITAIFSPAIGALTAGIVVLVKLAHTITGPTTIVVNGNAAKNVSKPDGSALGNQAAIAGAMLLLSYDGVQFQLLAGGGSASSAASYSPGCIYLWPLETPDDGLLECDGSAKSRATYARLYAKIGVKYGAGDGSTTFNLPDYRGESLRGWDHGRGADLDVGSRTNRGDGTTGDHVGTKQGAAAGPVNFAGGSITITSPMITETRDITTTTYPLETGEGEGGSIHAILEHGPATVGAVVAISGTAAISGTSGGDESRPRNVSMMICIGF